MLLIRNMQYLGFNNVYAEPDGIRILHYYIYLWYELRGTKCKFITSRWNDGQFLIKVKYANQNWIKKHVKTMKWLSQKYMLEMNVWYHFDVWHKMFIQFFHLPPFCNELTCCSEKIYFLFFLSSKIMIWRFQKYIVQCNIGSDSKIGCRTCIGFFQFLSPQRPFWYWKKAANPRHRVQRHGSKCFYSGFNGLSQVRCVHFHCHHFLNPFTHINHI